MAEGLRIPIDVTGALPSGKAIRGVTDELGRLDRQFNIVTPQLIKFNKAASSNGGGFTKITKGSGQAGQALTEFNRIIQDSPFGIIAVVNNAQQLGDVFGQLIKSSGGVRGALKAVGGAVSGAGGLSLAFSVITTAVSFASIGFGAWTRGLKGSKEAADALTKSIDESAKTIAGEIVRLTTLVGLIENVNTSISDREKGLRAFNQEYGKYLDNIDKEKVGLAGLRDAYQEVIDALIRRAVVKGLQDQIAAEVEKTAKKILAISIKQQTEQNKIAFKEQQNAKKQVQNIDFLADARQRNNATVSDGILLQQQYNQEIRQAVGPTDAESGIARLKEQLLNLVAPLLNITTKFDDLDISLSKIKDKEPFTDILAAAQKAADFLRNNTFFEIGYQFNPLESKEEQYRKAQSFLNDVAKLRGGLSIPFTFKTGEFADPLAGPPEKALYERTYNAVEEGFRKGILEGSGSITQNVMISTTGASATEQALSVVGEFARVFQQNKIPLPPIDLTIGATGLTRELTDALRKGLEMARLTEQLNNIVKDFASSLAVGIGEGIGNALSGAGNAFGSLFKILGAGMKQFGQALIEFGIAKIALDKLFKGAGAAGAIAAGIGLVALGQVVSNYSGPKFAQGGLVYGPTIGMIGEGRGTNSSNPEVIAPLDKLRSMLEGFSTGGAQVVVVNGKIKGNDIQLTNSRTSKRNKRLGAS